MMSIYSPCVITQPRSRKLYSTVKAMSDTTSTEAAAAPQRKGSSAFEARLSLVLALASQTSSLSQRLLMDLATESSKYLFPRRFEPRNLEEALMSVPDLETVKFQVLSRSDQYEIRQVEPYFIAETTMPGKYGFDLNGASQSFNVLAGYLFGKNTTKESMEMTTPVFTRRTPLEGEEMEMTTPVITTRLEDHDKWQMSFVMPSKYGSSLPLPKDPSVSIKEVPSKIVAVVAFSGFVTDEEVKQREAALRSALKDDSQSQVKIGVPIEVAQVLLSNYQLNPHNSAIFLFSYFQRRNWERYKIENMTCMHISICPEVLGHGKCLRYCMARIFRQNLMYFQRCFIFKDLPVRFYDLDTLLL